MGFRRLGVRNLLVRWGDGRVAHKKLDPPVGLRSWGLVGRVPTARMASPCRPDAAPGFQVRLQCQLVKASCEARSALQKGLLTPWQSRRDAVEAARLGQIGTVVAAQAKCT